MGFMEGLFAGRTAELQCIACENKDKAIIFVHGLFDDPQLFWQVGENGDSLLDLVSDDADFADYDMYTYGHKSALSPFHFSIKSEAETLRASLKEQLPWQDLYFVAHSQGGLTVLQYITDCLEEQCWEEIGRVRQVVSLAWSPKNSRLARLMPFHRQGRTLRLFSRDLRMLEKKWLSYRQSADDTTCRMFEIFQERVVRAVYDACHHCWTIVPDYLKGDLVFGSEGLQPGKAGKYKDSYALLKDCTAGNPEANARHQDVMVLWVHGWEKKKYKEKHHYVLDWSEYFNSSCKPSRYPDSVTWEKTIVPMLYSAYRKWKQRWADSKGKVRIYADICLTGGLLLGKHFSQSTGAGLEVFHEDGFCRTGTEYSDSEVYTEKSTGNSRHSLRAVVLLGKDRDIRNEVLRYLKEEHDKVEYSLMVSVLPKQCDGANAGNDVYDPVSYALGVNRVFEDLQNQGIQEVWLFMRIPPVAAVLVGHYLAVECSVQIFEYIDSGYVPSYRIGNYD